MAENREEKEVLNNEPVFTGGSDSISTLPVALNSDFKIQASAVIPQYLGGLDGLMKYIEENIEYPEEAKVNKEQGQVIVQFWVENSGEIRDVTVLKDVSSILDKEAIRLIRVVCLYGFQLKK